MYTKNQISKLEEFPGRSIQYYTERDVVTPEIDAGEGKGRTRIYSENNRMEFRIIKKLTDYKVPFNQIKTIMRYLKMPVPIPNSTGNIPKLRKITDLLINGELKKLWIALFYFKDGGIKFHASVNMETWDQVLDISYSNKRDEAIESILIINLTEIVKK